MYANTEKPLEMCFLEVSSSLDKGGQSKDFGGKTAIKCCTNCFFFPKFTLLVSFLSFTEAGSQRLVYATSRWWFFLGLFLQTASPTSSWGCRCEQMGSKEKYVLQIYIYVYVYVYVCIYVYINVNIYTYLL